MMDFNKSKTGQIIKELRKDAGLTQCDLAEKLGIAQNTIAQYEMGKASPSLDVIVHLAYVFNTTTDHLLGLNE